MIVVDDVQYDKQMKSMHKHKYDVARGTGRGHKTSINGLDFLIVYAIILYPVIVFHKHVII